MDTDLITTGEIPAPVRAQRTLIANQITAYLEQHDKALNQAVLDEMVEAFRRKVVKQLMSTRNTRKGHESCTVYSGACARKSRYQFDGVAGEPLRARSLLKFLMGDTLELDVIGVAQLAGVDLSMNNADLFITGQDGVKIQVHPDGLVCDWEWSGPVNTENGGSTILRRGLRGRYNLECKSSDTFTYDAWVRNGGPDDQWGYLTQASVEIAAWREAGYDVNSTCFIAVSTGSRQGSIAEWIIPYDQKLVDAWHDRRRLAQGVDLPARPFEAVPELEFVRGRALDAHAFAHGVPAPREDKNGKVIGHDVPTGRMILPTYCGYCAYKAPCWPGAVLDADDGKPVWTVQMEKQVNGPSVPTN